MNSRLIIDPLFHYVKILHVEVLRRQRKA